RSQFEYLLRRAVRRAYDEKRNSRLRISRPLLPQSSERRDVLDTLGSAFCKFVQERREDKLVFEENRRRVLEDIGVQCSGRRPLHGRRREKSQLRSRHQRSYQEEVLRRRDCGRKDYRSRRATLSHSRRRRKRSVLSASPFFGYLGSDQHI